MDYTCNYCRKPFNINPAEAASAVIDYTFGKKTHNFVCDNCGKNNALTRAQYEAAREADKNPKPVATTKPVAKPVAQTGPSWPGMQQTPKPVAKPAPKPIIPAPAPKPVTPAPITAPLTKREATKKTKEDNARRHGEDVSKGSKRGKDDNARRRAVDTSKGSKGGKKKK